MFMLVSHTACLHTYLIFTEALPCFAEDIVEMGVVVEEGDLMEIKEEVMGDKEEGMEEEENGREVLGEDDPRHNSLPQKNL